MMVLSARANLLQARLGTAGGEYRCIREGLLAAQQQLAAMRPWVRGRVSVSPAGSQSQSQSLWASLWAINQSHLRWALRSDGAFGVIGPGGVPWPSGEALMHPPISWPPVSIKRGDGGGDGKVMPL
jgi:hypothetical protein